MADNNLFADVDDVTAALLGVDLSAFDVTAVERLIRRATSKVRGWTGQNIAPPQAAVHVFANAAAAKLFLPHPPAIPVDVSTVLVGDVEQAGWQINGQHALTRPSGPWLGDVTVEYVHGFETAPGDVVEAVVQMVVRRVTNPPDVSDLTMGSDFRQGWGETLTEFDAAQLAALAHYKDEGVLGQVRR